METQQTLLMKIAESLPKQYLKELVDFAQFLREKSGQSFKDDTEYLNSIPGMTESIAESRKTEIQDCSEKLDW